MLCRHIWRNFRERKERITEKTKRLLFLNAGPTFALRLSFELQFILWVVFANLGLFDILDVIKSYRNRYTDAQNKKSLWNELSRIVSFFSIRANFAWWYENSEVSGAGHFLKLQKLGRDFYSKWTVVSKLGNFHLKFLDTWSCRKKSQLSKLWKIK